jgi:hypothetical protein
MKEAGEKCNSCWEENAERRIEVFGRKKESQVAGCRLHTEREREREMASAEALEVKFQIGSELFSARDRKERAGGGGSLLQGGAFQKKGGYLRWMVVFFSAQGESSCNAGEKLLEYI